MQLDSHHRFVKDWDTKCIKMLHNSDAGEYTVLSTYGAAFDLKNGYSEIALTSPLNAMVIYEIRKDASTTCAARPIMKNADKLTKPYASPAYSAHFNFSYGKFLLDAGYDT